VGFDEEPGVLDCFARLAMTSGKVNAGTVRRCRRVRLENSLKIQYNILNTIKRRATKWNFWGFCVSSVITDTTAYVCAA
jgi:hypothetical protein